MLQQVLKLRFSEHYGPVSVGPVHHPPVNATLATPAASHVDALGGYTFTICFWIFALVLLLFIEFLVVRFAKQDEKEDDAVLKSRSAKLPESMWSLVTLCAIKQTQWKGVDVPQWLAAVIVFSMGCLQLSTLYLIMHTLNPDAQPVTVHTSTPWNREPWTVNWMKWIMTFFLALFLSVDAGQFGTIMREIFCLHQRRWTSMDKFVAGSLCATHFLVLTCTVFVGVCSVLSFQAVPDILYSSLAITFIAHVDEMAWEFMQNGLGLDADFTIVHEAGDESVAPLRLESFLRATLLFPLLLAFYVIGVGFYTDIMPKVLFSA